jgi:transcriptional regulator with XRE-family HTH domain
MQNKLKELRIAKGLSRQELARRIENGYTLSGRADAICQIEWGQALPTFDFRAAIADVLGFPPEEICDAINKTGMISRTTKQKTRKRQQVKQKKEKEAAKAEHLQNIKGCKGCRHWRPLGRQGHEYVSEIQFACHYLYDTGQMRGCPPSQCVHNDGAPCARSAHVATK